MKIFYAFILITVLLSCPLFSQEDMASTGREKGPTFFIDIANLAVPGNDKLSRLNIYAEVLFDNLQFLKLTDGYEANYEITAVIYDKDDYQVDGKIWKESIFVTLYDETNDRNKYSLSFNNFDVDPGKYKVFISVMDVESNLKTPVKFKVELKDFSKEEFMVSDISYLSNVTFDSLGIKSIQPIVSNLYKGLVTPSFAYLEVYNKTKETSAKVNYQIKGVNNKLKIVKSFPLELKEYRTLVTFPLPVDSLGHDTFQLTIEVKTDNNKAKVDKDFTVRFNGMPTTAKDLKTAIEQVVYIATTKEWDMLKDAVEADKLEEFKKFWRRHDPTPGTDVNEAMEAHYSRVEFANQQFSVMQREGWRSDRGMVYIILGPPDDIVRDAYPSDSRPWQVWNYYRINRQFEFVDFSGFGDYRFYRPYSMYELQLYMRN